MKVAIAGYGTEGAANFTYWNTPENDVTIIDERSSIADLPVGVNCILGENAFSRLKEFDLVVRTAGLAPSKITTDGKVWSGTNEFFAQCPAPIIGITGTKGKGTTSSLIASILRAAGKTVHLVGNIGMPAISVLKEVSKDDIVVYELSSFQLWDAVRSPHVAVVLMIERDHLDVHANFEEYIDAKSNIARWQTSDDSIVYYEQNDDSERIAMRSKARRIPYTNCLDARGENFVVKDTVVAPRSSLQLPGTHNIENASAAILAAWQFTQDTTAIRAGLEAFRGLEHRLQYVATVSDIRYYDDSIATTPGSAIAAINSFASGIVLILGGSDKGADYDELIRACSARHVHVVAVGAIKQKIIDACKTHTVSYSDGGSTMSEIVNNATAAAQPGDVVVLSPAAASFDMFSSYSERGEQFAAAVHALTFE